MLGSIDVKYTYTNIPYKALQLLKNAEDLSAYDFEVVNKLTEKTKKEYTQKILTDTSLNKHDIINLTKQIEATGLSHPSLTCVSHLAVASKKDEGFVIICDTDIMRNLVFNFLVTTDKTQIWHRSLFDFKHIFYHTKKLPKNYVDTQLLAKSLLNDADNFKSLSSLKELMGWQYGTWSLFDNDTITLENMFEQKVIKYACTDACATKSLYEDIMHDLYGWRI